MTADGASIALQGWDMLHGNVFLHGWSLSDVSFYTTELPEYAAVEAVRGLGAFDVHISAAISYTLLVLLAGLLAKGRATGRAGLLRMLIASGIMIAPQIGPGALLLLLSPDHTGTGVPLLLIWLFLDRAPRRRYVPVLVGLALTWAAIGDHLVALMGALPIAVMCGIQARKMIRRDRRPVRQCWYEISLGGAAIASALATWALDPVIAAMGGYSAQTVAPGFGWPWSWWSHLKLTAEGVLGLYGADFTHRPLGTEVLVASVHVIGLGLAAWGLCAALRRLSRDGNLVEGGLALALIVNLVVFTVSSLPHTQWDAREIAVVLPYGAVLAGRLLHGALSRPAVRPGLLAWGACYLLALGFAVSQPARPAHDSDLAGWLTAHHMTCGLGSYAEGNTTTLDSGGRIQLRAPTWTSHGAWPGVYEAKDSWFSPNACDATFVESLTGRGPFSIPPAWATAAFGPPVHTYQYRSFTIWVWHGNLLDRLRPPPVVNHPPGGYVSFPSALAPPVRPPAA